MGMLVTLPPWTFILLTLGQELKFLFTVRGRVTGLRPPSWWRGKYQTPHLLLANAQATSPGLWIVFPELAPDTL